MAWLHIQGPNHLLLRLQDINSVSEYSRCLNRLSMSGVRRSGSPGLANFFLTSTRWLPMYENQNPVTNSREKCYQIYLWPFQTSKMNFLPNDPFFYRSVPKVAYWWVEQHITRSVSVPQPLQSYRMMKFHIASKLSSYMRILLRKFFFFIRITYTLLYKIFFFSKQNSHMAVLAFFDNFWLFYGFL